MVFAALVLLGCWAYCILAIAAAVRHARSRRPAALHEPITISVLKPLAGLDEDLEENLRSFFEQDYTHYELLFAVRHQWDPAVEIVQRLMADYPAVKSKLLLTGEPPYPHAKVFSLQRMFDHSESDLIVMSDSDVRVGRDFCRSLAAEFADKELALVTCPYRAIAGEGIWSRLEAVGMNTDFHAGLFTAVMMEGARFAVGPTIVARRHVLHSLGGVECVKHYLSSEDFMLGRIAADLGFVVRISRYVVEHRIGSEPIHRNFSHRLRWARTTRRSRPRGYVGQLFTQPLPVGLLLFLLFPQCWPLVAFAIFLRVAVAWTISEQILSTEVPWALLPLQDLLGFAFWIAGFFGDSIEWRGRRYILKRDGTVETAGWPTQVMLDQDSTIVLSNLSEPRVRSVRGD